MKALNILFVFLLSVFTSSTVYNQKCADFVKSKTFRMSDPGSFLSYGQSRSESVEVRKVYKYKIVFFGKREYLLGVATEAGYEPVHIRLIDEKNNKVLYDNNKYHYKPSVDFYLEKPQIITIEITVLADNEVYLLPEELRVCLGIKIFNQSIN